MKKNVQNLIIGGGGFLGSHLAERLLQNGDYLRVLSTSECSFDEPLRNHKNLDWHTGDFTCKDQLKEAVEDVDVIFHLASNTKPQSSNLNPNLDIQDNLIGTLGLLDLLKTRPNTRIIFASSGGTVYGETKISPIPELHKTEPQCSYGIVKLCIEKYLALYNYLYGLEYRVLRFSNIYGPGQIVNNQGVIAAFIQKAICNEPIEVWGNGQAVRDYIYIDDAVNALVSAANYNGKMRLFNIGSGAGHNLKLLISTIERVLEKEIDCVYLPKPVLDVSSNVLDVNLANCELGWRQATTLEDGIALTASWSIQQSMAQ